MEVVVVVATEATGDHLPPTTAVEGVVTTDPDLALTPHVSKHYSV